MNSEVERIDDDAFRHLCRLVLAQYPLPRLRREQLEAVSSLCELDVPEGRPKTGRRTVTERSEPLEGWFRSAPTLERHLRTWCSTRSGRIVLYHSDAYPALLRQIDTPPVALFCEGTLPAPRDTAVAIVGSRSASVRARRFAHALAADLAQLGVIVVSGLARGIDSAAHEGACEAGGRTVAVVGNGTDVHYPPEHARLQQHIRETGCVMSELPPGTAPRSWHFPSRNRLLAGLVRGVVVVQAEQRSGALITARLALDENREVMAVPGDVEDVRSRGVHMLLRQGATLVETAADVLQAIGWESRQDGQPQDDRRNVLSLLARPRSAESLRVALGWTSEALQVCLTELELLGWVGRDARGRFHRRQGSTP